MKFTNNTVRINVLFIVCIVLLFCAIIGKLGYVALATNVEGTNLAELAANRTTTTKVLTASRGTIYDKTGSALAQNTNSYTVIAYLSASRTSNDKYPKHVVDKETTARELAGILEPLNATMTYEYILGLLSRNVYQVELGPGGKNITEVTKQKIENLALPGLDFTKTEKRYYPYADFASYIIGYAKNNEDSEEINGEMGIEGFCNRYLKGTDGTITYQKDAYGYQLATENAISYTTPAEDGYDVYLTLDHNVQMYLEDAIAKFEEFDPSWVTITVADAKTGAIVGSASTPSFDPNKLNITNYNNPLVSYTYEPGSTMKIFSFMSAIEEGLYNGEETYMSGTIPVADYTIKDWNRVGWGSITYDTGFTYSSNVAAANLAFRLKRKKLSDYYNNLGFASKTGIELAGELPGDVSIQYDTELVASSYGQGITVTPIQMIQALTVLTNDGTVMKPYIIDKIVNPNSDEIVYQGKKTELKKVYSTSTVNKITELMDMTVNGSDPAATGKVYSTPAVRLIGKTGTANYTGTDGKYITGSSNTILSFAGVFPKENPEYIIYLAVKDFKGASKDRGSIIKSLVESVAKYRNLDETPSDKDSSKVVKIENYVNSSRISAESKLANLGVNVVIIGDGDTIISQFPKRGTTTSQSSKVFLVTNGLKYTMPDIKGWSSSEVVNFCNLVGLEHEMNGYGYVVSTNLNQGDIIDSTSVLVVDLQTIDPESLVTVVGGNEDETSN